MTKLTGKARDALPTAAFAVPLRRAYPLDTPNRARNALARVSEHGDAALRRQVRDAVSRRYPAIKVKAPK